MLDFVQPFRMVEGLRHGGKGHGLEWRFKGHLVQLQDSRILLMRFVLAR